MIESEIFLSDQKGSIESNQVFNLFELKCHPKTFKKIYKHVDSGQIPLIVSNHQSHADGLAISLLTQKIIQNTKVQGFYLPIAASMVSGDQDLGLKENLQKLAKGCLQRGLQMIPVTRKKDIEKYGITDNNTESLRKLLKAHKENFGTVFLPEGSVQGGRVNLDGLINGMIKSEDDNAFDSIVAKYLKDGVEFCVIPMSIDGSYKMCDPTSYKMAIPDSKVLVTINKTILTNNDFKNLDDKPSSLVMPLIARNLSINAQGIYRK